MTNFTTRASAGAALVTGLGALVAARTGWALRAARPCDRSGS